MNNYEIVYIIHPALQEGRLSDIKNKIHDKIASFKGKVLYDDNWGKKKLAYAIDKQKYGTYLFCQFLLEGKDVKEINIPEKKGTFRKLCKSIGQKNITEFSYRLDLSLIHI